MAKIIDSFLFFRELDLLDMRLAYLDPYVDLFVIVEACQTFSGKPKPFVFEENAARFSKYLHKIHYHKIPDFHDSFDSLEKHLKHSNAASHSKVLRILLEHDHYPKSGLNWVLDSYHRESIHLPLDEIARDDDIIILSDLDEIPNEKIFLDGTLAGLGEKPRVCRQHEFRYFLNLYKDSDWLGSIFSRYPDMTNRSLNLLRIDSKINRVIVDKEEIRDGGYHFTSCGNIEAIAEKIKSWGHQEFNNERVLNRLEHNIRTGQDIFEREQGTILKKVNIEETLLFDGRLKKMLTGYPALLLKAEISHVKPNIFLDVILKLRNKAQRFVNKVAPK